MRELYRIVMEPEELENIGVRTRRHSNEAPPVRQGRTAAARLLRRRHLLELRAYRYVVGICDLTSFVDRCQIQDRCIAHLQIPACLLYPATSPPKYSRLGYFFHKTTFSGSFGRISVAETIRKKSDTQHRIITSSPENCLAISQGFIHEKTNCNPILNAIQNRQIAAIHPFREKKIINIRVTVANTFTRSGMVWAMKFSIFSTFCSIIFLMLPVDVLFRYPNDKRPMCSDSLIRSPYRIRESCYM